jgi:putative copper resistance protein D
VLLRGLVLAFEAFAVGGVIFQLWIARDSAARRAWNWVALAAALLVITQLCIAAADAAILLSTTDLSPASIAGADFVKASLLMIGGAIAVIILSVRGRGRIGLAIACLMVLLGSTMLSHSSARVEWRWILMFMTLLHHAAGAAWIGGLPFLLLTLRQDSEKSLMVTSRFSGLAITSVGLLLAAGMVMGWLYVGSGAALGGTTYGIMLLSKVVLTAILLMLGLFNRNIVAAAREGKGRDWLPLSRFTEAEIGIGFTVLLAAASLTSSPPAVDVVVDRVTPQEIVDRMTPRMPR